MKLRLLALAAVVILLAGFWQVASAAEGEGDVTRGGALYADWITASGAEAPAGDMPLWSSQTTSALSGPATWQCSTCHGWDYRGVEGANRSGQALTGFPGVLNAAQTLEVSEIEAILRGEPNPEHDFSAYLDDQSIRDLAAFVKNGAVDTSGLIDLQTQRTIGADAKAGAENYQKTCEACHGVDGMEFLFRFHGQDAGLGLAADAEPWKFLHITQYGKPGTDSTVGVSLNWTTQDALNVLAYAQTLPSDRVGSQLGGSLKNVIEGPQSPPGTSGSIFAGLATAAGAMISSLGFVILLGAGLIGVIFLLVWYLK